MRTITVHLGTPETLKHLQCQNRSCRFRVCYFGIYFIHGSMVPNGTYFGPKVPIQGLLQGQSIFCLGTWALKPETLMAPFQGTLKRSQVPGPVWFFLVRDLKVRGSMGFLETTGG